MPALSAGGDVAGSGSSWFRRLLLPGLAFKGFVIGGGYATGRELAEFFLGSGPLGGVFGLVLTMLIWSAVCAIAFGVAHKLAAFDYRSLFGAVLGPFWVVLEIAFLALLVLVLAVVTAAAGEIFGQVLGLPPLIGMVTLGVATVAITAAGQAAVGTLFKYGSICIYGIYVAFFVLAFLAFGDRIPQAFATATVGSSWVAGGISYASYNVLGLVAALPFLRAASSRRDAVIAGALCGPLAILPAIGFFLCMAAWYPEIASAALPSDFLLTRIGSPWFHLLFQFLVFVALLETAIGGVSALADRLFPVMERAGIATGFWLKLAFVGAVLLGSTLVATRIGLIDLIAQGYGFFGWLMAALVAVPMLTVGLWRLLYGADHRGGSEEARHAETAA